MSKVLNIAKPPLSESEKNATANTDTPTKFKQLAEDRIVRFNKNIKKGTADGYAMLLSIKTESKIPKLLEEGLALLEKKIRQGLEG